MGKKLLVILGIVAVTGYIFRDRIAAGAMALGGKISAFVEDVTERVEELNESKETGNGY